MTSRFATQLDASAVSAISVYNLKRDQFWNVTRGVLLPHTYTLCGPRNDLTSNNFSLGRNILYTTCSKV